MKELNYVYVGKAKDFKLWNILLHTIKANKKYKQGKLQPDVELLKYLKQIV